MGNRNGNCTTCGDFLTAELSCVRCGQDRSIQVEHTIKMVITFGDKSLTLDGPLKWKELMPAVLSLMLGAGSSKAHASRELGIHRRTVTTHVAKSRLPFKLAVPARFAKEVKRFNDGRGNMVL